MLERNRIYNMDCVAGMKLLDDGSIDLTVTSPPYDNLRMYKGYSFDFDAVAAELFRVTKDGGVVVWVVKSVLRVYVRIGEGQKNRNCTSHSRQAQQDRR